MLYGPEAVAIAFSSLSLISLVLETHYMFSALQVKTSLIGVAFRPLTSAIIMAIAVYFLPVPSHWPLIFILLTKVVSGGIIYGGLLVGQWKLSGYKHGPEYTLYRNFPKKLQKLIPLRISE